MVCISRLKKTVWINNFFAIQQNIYKDNDFFQKHIFSGLDAAASCNNYHHWNVAWILHPTMPVIDLL